MIKDYLLAQKEKRSAELEALKEAVAALEKKNNESENAEELERAGEELEALLAKKEELLKELEELEAQIVALEEPQAEEKGERKNNFIVMNMRGANNMNIEERQAKALKVKETGHTTIDTRAVLLSTGNIATPTEVNGINDKANEVSSIVDMVNVVDCYEMGRNVVAYEKTSANASTKTEGQAAATSEPTFGKVEITPTSYGLLSFVSDQIKKQSPLNYEEKINKSAYNGLRKALSKAIVDKIKASTLNVKVNGEVKTGNGVINDKTLRNLVLQYGGDENVEGNGVLFLNKTDLLAFGDVRGTNEKKAVYEIVPNTSNPNTGVIKDGGLAVNYCINSNLTAISGTKQPLVSQADLPTMVYGNPKAFELDLFGDAEVEVSKDYKFGENMLTIRGQVDAGGDVVVEGGFVVLMLPKASA